MSSSNKKPHIVFLFSDTGRGHRSAALAISEALEIYYPDQVTTEPDASKDIAGEIIEIVNNP